MGHIEIYGDSTIESWNRWKNMVKYGNMMKHVGKYREIW
jgi:hypothetical protein